MGWSDTLSWAQEIAEITTSTDYLNAVVTIVDPELITYSGAWDIDTNTPPTVVNNGIIAADIPARINWPLRAVRDPGSADANPAEIRPGRMSIPWSSYSGPLRTGLQIYVSNGGDNVDLPRYVLRIEEALNSSSSAARVMKIAVEGEATYMPTVPVVAPGGSYGDPQPGDPGYGA